jgi:hypothetical protein
MHPRRRLGSLLAGLFVASLVAACLPAGATKDADDPGLAAQLNVSPAPVSPPPDAALEGPLTTEVQPAPSDSLLDRGPVIPALPVATPTPALPRPTKGYAMNLFASGDFVAQYTFEWCVGASIQMALNIMGANDRTKARQQELWELAQSLSESPFGGANARGWTAALNVVGLGPYQLVSEPDLDGALRRAAAAMRETRRPVGLLMWRGRHAWVMSGFTSLGDPATVPNFEVTGVRVLDPLYPNGDDDWGPSPRPNALLDPTTLGQQFVPRLQGRVNYGIPPGYFLVLPVTSLPAAVTDPAF